MATINDDLLSKLEKLKNLKEGAAAVGSHAEAANAAAKMQELLLKHNLSEQDVITEGIRKKATMADDEFDVNEYQSKTEADWVYRLIQYISDHTMCSVVKRGVHRNGNRYDQGIAVIIGESNNVATTLYMVEQLISKINIACKEAWKTYSKNGGYEKRNTFRRGFLVAAVNAIGDKLDRQRDNIIHQPENKGMDLMIVTKAKMAEERMMELFPNLKFSSRRSTSLSGMSGAVQGYRAGSQMELNKGVDGNKANKFLN